MFGFGGRVDSATDLRSNTDNVLGVPSIHSVAFSNGQSTCMQTSIHPPGRHLLRELRMVFHHYNSDCQHHHLDIALPANSDLEVVGGVDAGPGNRFHSMLMVLTFQQSKSDLMVISKESNKERDDLLEYFSAWGQFVIEAIRAKGFWADMTDPASGYPVYTARGPTLYPDVDGAAKLLRYQTHHVGCCRVISHPSWGTRNYPATLFTTCPSEDLAHVLADSFSRVHPLGPAATCS